MTDDISAIFDGDRSGQPSFRKRMGYMEPTGEALPPVATDDGPYKPYGFFPSGTVGDSCEVRGWVDGTTIPVGTDFPYRLKMGVDFYADTELRILLPNRIIVIEGQKLTELGDKLRRNSVTFIQQHHSGVWSGWSRDLPRITRIEIIGANDTERLPQLR